MYLFKEHRLQNAHLQLTIAPHVGCHWMSLKVAVQGQWVDVLWPSPDVVTLLGKPFRGGCYLMAPWCNRIASAAFEFNGEKFPLRSNHSDGTAIHGDVYARLWEVNQATEQHFDAVLDSRVFFDFNFPAPILVRHKITLSELSIRAELEIKNLSDRAIPAGVGFHPFFLKQLAPLSGKQAGSFARVTIPAKKVYPAEGAVPTGPAAAVSPQTDLSGGASVENRVMDHGYTDLSGETLSVAYDEPRLNVKMKLDKEFGHVFVYSPADYEGAATPFVCVEPLTHAVNGFNQLATGWKGTGVKVLEPNETWGGGITISIE